MIGKLFSLSVFILLSFSLVSAGIGIRSDQTSIVVKEGESACIESVSAYNPFATVSRVIISVSPELQEVLIEQSAEEKLIPAETSSANSIPLKFCFKVPNNLYEKDYASVPLVGNVIDKIDCTDKDIRTYSGEVILESVPSDSKGGYGSATMMSVSTPLNIRVTCPDTGGWRYTKLYLIVAILSAGVVGFILFRKYRRPKSQRLKERMDKLKEEMRKSK